jgi:hypothetical protein
MYQGFDLRVEPPAIDPVERHALRSRESRT